MRDGDDSPSHDKSHNKENGSVDDDDVRFIEMCQGSTLTLRSWRNGKEESQQLVICCLYSRRNDQRSNVMREIDGRKQMIRMSRATQTKEVESFSENEVWGRQDMGPGADTENGSTKDSKYQVSIMKAQNQLTPIKRLRKGTPCSCFI